VRHLKQFFRHSILQHPQLLPIAHALCWLEGKLLALAKHWHCVTAAVARLLTEQGTINLIDAAKAKGVQAFVLQTSLLTNAAAVGQKNNPNYKLLNLFGGVLDRKLVRRTAVPQC
jgi:hypothetical protein